MSKQILCIVGPTATGKSKVALALALKYNCEIVNADAMQLYKGMDIGTAKLTKSEQKNIPHYQINVLLPNNEANVAIYRKNARMDIEYIKSKNKIPILCGGSGLYIKSVLDNFEFPKSDINLRQKLEKIAYKLPDGKEKLYLKLKKINPESLKNIDTNNTKRIIRALEASILGNFTSKTPNNCYYYKNVKQIGLVYDNLDTAKTIISKRTDAMFKNNFIEEVENLNKIYNLSRTAKMAIGYRQILDYLNNKADLKTIENVKDLVKLKTFQLYKNQIKWFKRDARIKWDIRTIDD